MINVRNKAKVYYQYAIQLLQRSKFLRYLRDHNNQPFSFSSRDEANIFAKNYLNIRNKKSLTIKIVEITIKLPHPNKTND